MAKKRKRTASKQKLRVQIAGVAALAILVIFMGCSLLQDGDLPGDAGALLRTVAATVNPDALMRTTVATIGVDIGLATSTPIVHSDPSGALAVYFTDPSSAPAGEALEAAMAASIAAAQSTVDVAIYNISNENLAEALLQAHRRGVLVRMVMESEAMDRTIPAGLRAVGIPIIGDQREGLMHNKFIVIDRREVWMGSANFTDSGFYQDSNNMVRIQSEQMAQNYTVNFEEMFTERRFGPAKQPNTPYPRLTVGQIPVEVYFSPDDGVAQRVLEEINAARSSIHFLAYSYTRDDFAEAMLAQAGRGVRVRGVFDQSQYASNTGGEFDNLRAAGLDVRLDGFPGLLHDKLMVIDQQIVITGSYNFSANAERSNDENIIIIRDPTVAAQYLQHFERAYQAAAP